MHPEAEILHVLWIVTYLIHLIVTVLDTTSRTSEDECKW
jgi:hypothetical protein